MVLGFLKLRRNNWVQFDILLVACGLAAAIHRAVGRGDGLLNAVVVVRMLRLARVARILRVMRMSTWFINTEVAPQKVAENLSQTAHKNYLNRGWLRRIWVLRCSQFSCLLLSTLINLLSASLFIRLVFHICFAVHIFFAQSSFPKSVCGKLGNRAQNIVENSVVCCSLGQTTTQYPKPFIHFRNLFWTLSEGRLSWPPTLWTTRNRVSVKSRVVKNRFW